MLGIVYKGVAFPLLFTMLDKRGNSNSEERIDLINRFICLFGKQVIESVVADREFVGEHFKVFLLHKDKVIKASHLFTRFKTNEFVHYNKIVKINGQLCYLSGCKLNNKKGKQDFLIIVSFNKPEKAQEEYKQRWQIEICFKAMTSSGFDI